MKYKITILVTLILLYSCKDSTQEKKEVVIENQVVSENEKTEEKSELIQTNNSKVKNEISDCDKYWMNRFPNDSLKRNI